MTYVITHIHPPFDPNCKVCAARDRPGVDVPTDLRERNRLFPHPHEPVGACRICEALTALAEAQQREGAGSFDPRKPHGRVTPIKCPGCGQLVLYDDSRGGRHVPSTHRHPAQQREGAGE